MFHLTIQPVNLATLARETAALLQRPDAPIQVNAPVEALAEADPDRMRQALENLLANAQRYTPIGVPVELTVQVDLRNQVPWVVFVIVDQGPGISADRLPQLFRRFGAGPESKGLGLGLYLAHEIAVAHCGSLTVESQPGQGALFTLAVPAAGPTQNL